MASEQSGKVFSTSLALYIFCASNVCNSYLNNRIGMCFTTRHIISVRVLQMKVCKSATNESLTGSSTINSRILQLKRKITTFIFSLAKIQIIADAIQKDTGYAQHIWKIEIVHRLIACKAQSCQLD